MKTFRVALLVLLAMAPAVSGQLPYSGQYNRGQDVVPVYEGWMPNPDGTYTMYFGYFNRNSDEEVDIPIGPDNNFDLNGKIDQGQPTHFYPNPRWWVFGIVVPKDWPKDKRVVWTLNSRGMTSQAKGWLEPEWEVDQGIISKNSPRDSMLMTVSIGDIDFENKAPALTGSPAQNIKLGDPLTLTVTATDDGRPKPLANAGGRQQGVRIRWIVYRGSGKVRFDPEIMPQRVYGKPATLETKVTFNAAGDYRLRAIASDGQVTSAWDVDVKVRN
jgi:hypothetical protein